ncbi:Thimet oligopeptidase [Fasciola hepatica]|uniref:Thimet oligopeptidase n=1 Tax=Fasciola hepatica TaxID=6192 RepID=A0A4E0RDE7_FASHE|nr:Thimet oligopeptidase [Fasciola hepatica]
MFLLGNPESPTMPAFRFVRSICPSAGLRMMSVPGCRIQWDVTVEGIKRRTDSLVEKARAVYDSIASTNSPSWETVAKHVSPDKEVRHASCDAARKFSDVEVELEMRKDVFDQFVSVQSKLSEEVPAIYKRYIDRKVRNGRRNGLHLDEGERKKMEALSKEENQLAINFEHALNEECTLLEFSDEELGECVKENRPILKRLMEIRKERSILLGFPTHADFMLDIRMAKSAKNVSEFLQEVAGRLEPLRVREKARLLELKKEECERLGLPFSDRLEPWDFRYYMNLAKEKDFAVDQQKLKKYFPLKVVKSGVLRLYQQLLGLTFCRVETSNVWHSDVEMVGLHFSYHYSRSEYLHLILFSFHANQNITAKIHPPEFLYSVTDTDSSTLLGYFYLDLHPRDGKYSHAAVFDLQPSCLRQVSSASGESEYNVEHQVAVSAMVANFTGPGTEQQPAYMLHDEVETFFHEFGHLMHQICARSDLALFSGTRVETDFVECPSQMLENWVWSEQGLNALLGELAGSMPKEDMDKLLKSRNANAGIFYARQLLLATFDQAIHTNRWQDDPQDVFIDLSREIIEIDPTPGTCMPASFQHLAGGYDARYYGYLWSLVYSADLYESRFHHAPDGGCLSPTVGREYRAKILRPGGTKDAIDMIRDFLGREPDKKAFFKLLGVEP